MLLLYIEGNRGIYSMTFRTPRPSLPSGGFCFGVREMRRVFGIFILSLFLVRGAFAECVSVDTTTKCARLPEGVRMIDISLQDSNSADDVSWSSLLYDHQSSPEIIDTHQIAISGTARVDSWDVVCTITSPFYAEVICGFGWMPEMPSYVSPANSCAEWNCDMSAEIHASALPNDVCPDGFYTVPYEISCGEGLVDVAGVPECENDVSGDYCLIPLSSTTPCVSTDTVTKCARLPTGFRRFNIEGAGDYTDSSWSIIYDGAVYSGNSAECMSLKIGYGCQCVVNSPFNAVINLSTGPLKFGTAYEACSRMMEAEMVESYVFDGRLDGDMCPDGFYTVPYDMSCGEGLVDVVGVPECENDVSGDYCLMPPSAAPCAAGITTLRTGTGVSIPLWAERGTEPSLCVKYNDMVCYGNLEPGQATGAINVKYGGAVYHTVD